jgi:hypothetical protein
MTSDQIAKGASDLGWNINEDIPCNPNVPTEVANLRMSFEVAYQLAILNEQICGVLNTRIPQVRVMVEQGEWPLEVKVREGR